jgi:soluble cytochrome b562
MKAVRYLILTGMAVASLCAASSAWAQVSSTPSMPPVTVVPPTATDLAGVPKGIQILIGNFNLLREKFLAAQNLLQSQLKNATTATERQQIRAQLQANRQAFLDALKDFRQQLKSELTALKGKISHEEFLRIIDAAHNAAVEGGLSHHKGH